MPSKSKKPKKSKAKEPEVDQIMVRRVDELMSTEAPEVVPEPETAADTGPDPAESDSEADTGPESADTEQESPAAEEPAPDQDDDPLEDSDNDKAVDDIVAGESDTILAVNDAVVARARESAEPVEQAGPRIRHKWAWFIFLIILVGSAADLYIFLSK